MLKFLTSRKLLLLLIIILIVGLVYYFSVREQPLEVETIEFTTTAVEKTVSGSGNIKSQIEASLSFPLTGIITEVYVMKSSHVEKGDTLARIYVSDAFLATQSQRSARDVAKRDLELYIENYNTNRNAVGGSDEYEIGVKRLQELLNSAESSYQSSLAALSKYSLQAPFTGTILDVVYSVGETAVAGTTVVQLADLTNLIFEVALDQEDFRFVKAGQEVKITLDSYPGEEFLGSVIEVPLFVNTSDQQSFIVKMNIEPKENFPILLGMTGDVDISIESTGNEVQALLFDQVFYESDNQAYVWVVDEGKLRKYPVETGIEGDIYTEIKTNLEGLTVVRPTDTDQSIEEGMRVKLSN